MGCHRPTVEVSIPVLRAVLRAFEIPVRLANSLPALYPEDSEEKPLLGAGLSAVSQG